MYARLRQKLSITNAITTTVTSPTNWGNNAMSLLIKDIGRLITGASTSISDLNSEIWDLPNSEVVNTQASGWSEYQSNLLTTSTNIWTGNDATAALNSVYFRCPSVMTSNIGGTVYKYGGLGISNNDSTGANNIYWNTLIPWTISNFTGNPTASYFYNNSSGTNPGSTTGRCSFSVSVLNEYIIYASPRCLLVSTRNIGANATLASKVYMQLEYPETAMSKSFNLPNQVIWEISNGVGSSAVVSTGTGANFITTAYNNIGGYTPSTNKDIFSNQVNANLGLVYTPYPLAPTGGWNSFWSSSTGTSDASTLKPATYGSMSNTVNSSGNTISVPAMPLIHYPSWDTVYDMSTLTGIYATRTGLGSTGDTLTLNGQNYAYINATNMSYLVPRQ